MNLSDSHKPATDGQLLASIERLDRHRSEIARRMAAVAWTEVPEYGAVISEERQAEMVRHADQTLRLLSEVVRAGVTFDSGDLGFVRANAELRAEQGSRSRRSSTHTGSGSASSPISTCLSPARRSTSSTRSAPR